MYTSYFSSFDKFNFKLFTTWRETKKNATNIQVKACNRKTDHQLPICFVQRPVTASSIKVMTKYTYCKTLQTQKSPSLKNNMGQNPTFNSWMPDDCHSTHPATFVLTLHHQVLPCTTINWHSMKIPENIR